MTLGIIVFKCISGLFACLSNIVYEAKFPAKKAEPILWGQIFEVKESMNYLKLLLLNHISSLGRINRKCMLIIKMTDGKS
jgi:hypothetical protein